MANINKNVLRATVHNAVAQPIYDLVVTIQDPDSDPSVATKTRDIRINDLAKAIAQGVAKAIDQALDDYSSTALRMEGAHDAREASSPRASPAAQVRVGRR